MPSLDILTIFVKMSQTADVSQHTHRPSRLAEPLETACDRQPTAAVPISSRVIARGRTVGAPSLLTATAMPGGRGTVMAGVTALERLGGG
jgi:hypothetical protein